MTKITNNLLQKMSWSRYKFCQGVGLGSIFFEAAWGTSAWLFMRFSPMPLYQKFYILMFQTHPSLIDRNSFLTRKNDSRFSLVGYTTDLGIWIKSYKFFVISLLISKIHKIELLYSMTLFKLSPFGTLLKKDFCCLVVRHLDEWNWREGILWLRTILLKCGYMSV